MSKKKSRKNYEWIDTIKYGEPDVGEQYYVLTRTDGYKIMKWNDADDTCPFGYFRDKDKTYTRMKVVAWCKVGEHASEKELAELRQMCEHDNELRVQHSLIEKDVLCSKE